MDPNIFSQFDDEETSPEANPDALFAPENNPLLPQDENAEHLRAYADLFDNAHKAEVLREAGRSIGRELFSDPPLAFQPDDPSTVTEAEAIMRATRPRTPHFMELFHPQLPGGVGTGLQMFGEGLRQHSRSGFLPRVGDDIGAALAARGRELAANAPPLQVPSYTAPLESFRKGEVAKGLAQAGTYIYEQIGRGAGTAAPMFAAGGIVGVPGVVLAGWNMGVGQMRSALAEEMDEYAAKANLAERSGDMASAAAYRAVAARLDPDNQGKVIYAAGTVIGLLDALIPGQIIAGNPTINTALKELTARYVISTLAKSAAAGSLKEGITEALQGATEVVGIAHAKGADHAAVYLRALADNSDKILEEGIAGAAAGVGFGVVEGAGRTSRQQEFIEQQRPAAMEVARATPVEAEPNPFDQFDEAPAAEDTQAGPAPAEPTAESAPEAEGQPSTEAQPTAPPRVIPDLAPETRTELLEVAEAAGIARETPEDTLAEMVDLRREGASFSAPYDQVLDEAIAEAEAQIEAQPPVTQTRVQELETQAQEAEAQIASLKEQVAAAEGEQAATLRQQLQETQARLKTVEAELKAVRDENAAFDRLRTYIEAGGSVSGANTRKAAKAAGVKESRLSPLLERAVSEGVLRKDRRGRYRRTPATAGAQFKIDPRDPNPVPAAVQTAIRAMMPRLPKGTKVKVFGKPGDLPQRLAQQVEQAPGEVDALFDDVTGDIYLSQAALSPQGRVGHEGIHALRNLDKRLKEQGLSGLFTDAEWNALVERANKVKDLFDRPLYERLFRERGYTDQRLKEALDEEAVAHLYEARVNGASYGKRINGLLDRIKEFFERVGNYLKGQGFQSAEDVMARVDSGEIAGRAENRSEEVAPGIRTRPWADTPPPVPGTVVRGDVMFAIRAFHGSPYDFDRFSSEKIGTGEGAQAYGHGLYFAESEGVAHNYRQALSRIDDSQFEGLLSPSQQRHAASFASTADTPELAMRDFSGWTGVKESPELLAAFERAMANRGRLYEVRINAEPDEFLDWDKPFAEQPERVKSAIAQTPIGRVFASPEFSELEALAARERDLQKRANELRDDPRTFEGGSMLREELRNVLDERDDTARQVRELGRKLADDFNIQGHGRTLLTIGNTHEDIYQFFGASPEDASRSLSEAGIKGIKYLDGFSRDEGEGTYNYVIFDDSLIEITAKDGKPVSQQEASDVLAASHGDDAAMFSLRQDVRPLEGVHYTEADFERFEITQRRDFGYWGRGVYMFPREFGVEFGQRNTHGLAIGIVRDGARNIPIIIDSKKPFVIDTGAEKSLDNAKAEWDALKPHGWEHDGPPVAVWNSREWDDAIKARIDTQAEKAKAERAKQAAEEAFDRLSAIEDEFEQRFGWEWPNTIREPGNEALLKRYEDAKAEADAAQEDAQTARRKAAPEAKLASQFTDALLAAGYDAVVVQSDGNPYEMVAIKPGTVRGAFSGDTMFSLRQAQDPLRGMAAIIRDLVHDMGITVRQGRGRGRFLGYNPKTGVIRQRSYYDIQALAQNAGRALEHRFGAPFAKILEAHGEDLTLPQAPNTPAPRLSPTGFSGLELDADLQALVVESAIAGQEVRQLAVQVGEAKAAPRIMPGRTRVDLGLQARYEAAQQRAGEARRKLVRRLGANVVQAIEADVGQRMPDPLDPAATPITEADLSNYVAGRFSATGTPQPAAQRPQPSREDLSDAFAEWMQLYLTNPTLAERQAPGLYDAFEDHVDDVDPVLLAKLQDTQTAIEELQKAAPGDLMQSMVAPADRIGTVSQLLNDASRDGILPTLGHRLSMLYTATLDKTHPMYLAVRRLLEVHEANTGQRLDLPAIENAYKLLRLAASSHSWAGRDLQDGIRPRTGVEGEGPSLTEALRVALGDDRAEAVDMSAGSRYRQFGGYLVARRAVKLWERYNNGLLPNPPTLQSEQAARDAITEFEARHPEFAQGAAMVYEFQRNLLRLQRDAGLISEEQYDTLLMDDDYVPFLRTFDELGDTDAGRTSVMGKAGIIKRLKGSNRDIIDPIASIAQKVYDTRAKIAVNDSVRALVKLAETAGPGGGAIAERLDATRAKALTVNALDALKNAAKAAGVDEADAQSLAEMAQDLIGAEATATIFTQTQITEGREPIVWMLEDGKPVPIRLADGWLGGAMLDLLTTFGNETFGLITNLMAVPTQLVRGTVTAHPTFILRNIFVDGFMANMYERKAWPWLTQISGFVEAMRNTASIRRYAATAGLMGGPATTALDKLRFDRSVRQLIEKGYEPKVWSSPGEWLTAMLDKIGADTKWGRARLAAGVGIGAAVGGPYGAVAGAVASSVFSGRGRRTIAEVSEASETGTRVRLYDIAFERAKAHGLDDAAAATEAAFFAQDYMDYSRHGSRMAGVAKTIAFLNAAMQGTDRHLYRLLTAKGDYGSAWSAYWKYRMKGGQLTAQEKQDLQQSAYAWFSVVMLLGIPSVIAALLWEDDDRIEEVPEEIRATHWVYPLDGVHHLVPKELPGLQEWMAKNLKDQSVRLPKPFEMAFVANIIERMLIDMRKGNPRWAENIAKDMWHTMLPPHMPQGLELPFELIAGKSFFTGRDIVPKWKQDRLIERQFDEYTSEFAKWLGPQIGVSPFYVDHGMKALGTSWARDFLSLNVPGTPWYDPNKPEKSVDDYFLARRFLWKVGKASESGQAVREIMGAEDPIRLIWGRIAQPYSKLGASGQTYKDYMNADDPASAVDLLDRLTPAERGYAILAGHFTDSASRYRMLHPMNRAERVMREIITLQKEILSDRVMSGKKTRTEKPIPLNPSEKAAARDILTQIQMSEGRNALVLTGETGWAEREMFDTASMLEELKAAAPAVAKEYERRLQKAKVLPFEGVQRVWPDVKRKLESDELMERIRQGRTSGLTSLLAVEYARARTGGGQVLRERDPEPATAN